MAAGACCKIHHPACDQCIGHDGVLAALQPLETHLARRDGQGYEALGIASGGCAEQRTRGLRQLAAAAEAREVGAAFSVDGREVFLFGQIGQQRKQRRETLRCRSRRAAQRSFEGAQNDVGIE